MSEDFLEIMGRHHRFLPEIAREVDQLIHENPSNVANFRRQVGVFVKKCESYLGEVKSGEQNPPYLLAPVLPEQYRSALPSPQNKQDLLPDYYFLLTLIHDNVLSPPQFVPINNGVYSMEDDWVKCCWSHYGRLMEGNKTEALIETALQHVKADLAVREEAERKSRQGKMGFHGRRPK